MYIRRKVFSTYIDENGEERLFSVNEIISEDEYVERLYAETTTKGKKKISKLDKANIWMAKKLNTKGDREAIIQAYDKDSKDFRPLAKRGAIAAGVGGGIAGGIVGAVNGPDLIGKTSKHIKTKRVAGGAAGALAFGAGTAAAGYAAGRLGGALVNKIRSKSEKADKSYQKEADIQKVASGKMSEEEFAEKYGK